MKVCFVVPDGVGIRNYLFSPIISHLKKQGVTLSIWHALESDVIKSIEELHEVSIENIHLVRHKEPLLGQILKEAAIYFRLKKNVLLDSNPSNLLDWSNKDKSFLRKILLGLAGLIGRSIKNYDTLLFAENYYYHKIRETPEFQKAVAILEESQPNLLFCTHQRSPEAALAIEAAKFLKIPTISVIYSWDNLPKARLLVKADQYIVWSDYMKLEMSKYYPEIAQERVFNLGTPQFDFHNNPSNILDRETFALENGLDPGKNWICFSGDDEITSPFDPLYLRDIAQETENMDEIELIFRPVPVSSHERYQEVISKFPHIKLISPKWRLSEFWSYAYPMFEDISMLTSLAFHCKAVVNVGSTMALDFACFDKPGLYLNYSPDGGNPEMWRPSMIYDRQHFRTMIGMDAVAWINSKKEIKSLIQTILDNPNSVAKNRIGWLNVVRLENRNESASERIAKLITNGI